MIEPQSLYLSDATIAALENDLTYFKSKTVNSIGKLIKRIIFNYCDNFERSNLELEHILSNSIKANTTIDNLDDSKIRDIAWSIRKSYFDSKLSLESHKKETKPNRKSLRINKNEEDTFDLIVSRIPKSSSLSDYLISIIIGYLNEPKYEREQIIYKNQYDAICKAIDEKRPIYIRYESSKGKDKKLKVIPYSIKHSNEELYNYLEYQYLDEEDNTHTSSIHLNKLISVTLLPESISSNSLAEESIVKFKRMEQNGIQFSIDSSDTYKVYLTNKGAILFNLRYLERPHPMKDNISMEGVYEFDCSEFQLINYFAPFYENAIIIEPISTQKKVYERQKKLLKAYSDRLNNL